MSTYHENAGKGDNRRAEDREAIESNWDKIDWSKKLTDEEKHAAFEKNKVANFKASTLLEKPFCTTCGNTKKVFDAGWEYDCTVCK